MITYYVIWYRRPGNDWIVEDKPILYDSMTEAECNAILGYEGLGFETKIVPMEG